MRFLLSFLVALPSLTLVGQTPPASSTPRGNTIEAIGTIDRGCWVYPADTMTLNAAHERYGVICSPRLDPRAKPLYGFARPARPYGRIVLNLSTNDTSASTSLRLSGGSEKRGLPVRLAACRGCFVFDSVAAGSYELSATIEGRRTFVYPVEIRPGELWEVFYVSDR